MGASLVLVTVRFQVIEAEAPALSVAVTFNAIVPTSELVGLAAIHRLLSILSQDGKLEPSALVSVYVSVSPESTSLNLFVGICIKGL